MYKLVLSDLLKHQGVVEEIDRLLVSRSLQKIQTKPVFYCRFSEYEVHDEPCGEIIHYMDTPFGTDFATMSDIEKSYSLVKSIVTLVGTNISPSSTESKESSDETVQWVYNLKKGDEVEIIDKHDQWNSGIVSDDSNGLLEISYGNFKHNWDRENFTTILSKPGTHLRNKGFTCSLCNEWSQHYPIHCDCANKSDERMREKMVGSNILVYRSTPQMELILEKNGEVFFISETCWRNYNDGFMCGRGVWTKFKESSLEDYLVYTRPRCYNFVSEGNKKIYEVYEPDLKTFMNRDKTKEWFPTYDPVADDKKRANILKSKPDGWDQETRDKLEKYLKK